MEKFKKYYLQKIHDTEKILLTLWSQKVPPVARAVCIYILYLPSCHMNLKTKEKNSKHKKEAQI